jgi:hypothetical protein
MLPLEQVIGEIGTMDYSTVSYTPSKAEIEHYQRLYQSGRNLNQKILATVPREAMESIASKLGLWIRNTLVVSGESAQITLMESCCYDWIHKGTNRVEHYAMDHVPPPDSDEYELLQAYRRARFRILKINSQIEGAGVYCSDFYSGEELFVMDMALSKHPAAREMALCGRLIFINPFWMTTGAAIATSLAIVEDIAAHLMKSDLVHDGTFTDEDEAALAVNRILLEVEKRANMDYGDPPAACRDVPLSKAIRQTNGPGRNSACPCGSGKRYKRCCGER